MTPIAPSRPASRAMTLIETAVSMTLVGVMLVAALSAVAAARRFEVTGETQRMGSALVDDLMNEILSKLYADTDDALAPGPSAAESATGNRSLFNDVNDYINWTESPPAYSNGSKMEGYDDWTRTVSIHFLDPGNRAGTIGVDQGIARITVAALHGGATVDSLVSIRTLGLPPTIACCLASGTCAEMTEADCLASGNRPRRPGSTCALDGCSAAAIAQWQFDENSGTRIADINGLHTGSLSNGPTWVTGKSGRALSFDGYNDYATVVHHTDLSLVDHLTICAWVYLNGNTGWQVIVAKGSSATPTINYLVGVSGTTVIFAFLNGQYYSFASLGTLPARSWTHVAVVYNRSAGTVSFYVEGALQSTSAVTGTMTSNLDPLFIGMFGAGSYFNGRLDDLRIYDRVLDSTQIGEVRNGK